MTLLWIVIISFLMFMAGYSVGHSDGFQSGNREGWHRGRAVNRQEFWAE